MLQINISAEQDSQQHSPTFDSRALIAPHNMSTPALTEPAKPAMVALAAVYSANRL